MIGVSDKAIAICGDHYTEDSMRLGCAKCPLETACRINARISNDSMIQWRNGINSVAEKVSQ